jgi:hypothetical protein
MRRWLLQPLSKEADILSRQRIVASLVQDPSLATSLAEVSRHAQTHTHRFSFIIDSECYLCLNKPSRALSRLILFSLHYTLSCLLIAVSELWQGSEGRAQPGAGHARPREDGTGDRLFVSVPYGSLFGVAGLIGSNPPDFARVVFTSGSCRARPKGGQRCKTFWTRTRPR